MRWQRTIVEVCRGCGHFAESIDSIGPSCNMFSCDRFYGEGETMLSKRTFEGRVLPLGCKHEPYKTIRMLREL